MTGTLLYLCESVWPGGKALVRLVSRRTSVRIRFGFPLSSKVVACRYCLVTALSLTINETLKRLSSLNSHLNAGVILVVAVIGRYIISLFHHLHTPLAHPPPPLQTFNYLEILFIIIISSSSSSKPYSFCGR